MTRVAVISDVHGNVPALEAVLTEIQESKVDIVVSCGDLTWGAEPSRTLGLLRALPIPVRYVRGNADRAVVELARGTREPDRPMEEWMRTQHSPAEVDLLESFEFSTTAEVEGLGAVRFCHGSPRRDTELVTPGTPEERFAELSRDIPEQTLVTGHTHLQFDRLVAGRRSVNPGSVGLPYHRGEPGTAYWAVLGPSVHLRQTRYDVEETIALYRGCPIAERVAGLLRRPPTPAEIVEDAETRIYAD
jgi:putative phosphoesterase